MPKSQTKPTQRKTRPSANRTRDRIVAAAADLFSERSFHGATTREIADVLRSLPSRLKRPYVLVGPSSEAPLESQNFMNRVVTPAVERADIRGFHRDDLRHTFASRLVMKGVDIRTVQELLGHADIRMTLRYSHLSPAHLLDAVEMLTSERTGTTTSTSDSSAKSAEGDRLT